MQKPQQDPTISISPMPPVQKGSMVIMYTGRTGTTLTVEFDPGGTQQVVIGGDGKATVTVPANATSVVVSGGGAAAVGSVVAPG